MKIEKIKITDLVSPEYNPRAISQEDEEKLNLSLKEYGIVDPIIVNLKNNHIIGGNQRYNVLLKNYNENQNATNELHLLKLGDIGWAFSSTDLKVKSEEHEKALNLALNKINGDWDNEKLNELLEEIVSTGFDTDLTGFSTEELNNMLNVEDEELTFESEPNMFSDDLSFLDEDFIFDKLEKQTKTFYLVKGDKWKIGNHTLIVGEVDKKDKLTIKIDFDDMDITFETLKGEDYNPLTEFKEKNAKCKGIDSKNL